MLSLVRALRDVAGAGGARGLSGDELERLDPAISDEVAAIARADLPGRDTPYHDVMRWVSGASRDEPVELFTTNYDLLAEQALEDVGVPYFDGFVGAREPFFDVRAIEDDALPPRWARLWKLHGSINWCRSDHGAVIRTPNPDAVARRLIHPSHLKYEESRRMPYLALHDRLRAALRRPQFVMVTCGFSFRDEDARARRSPIARATPGQRRSSRLRGGGAGRLEQAAWTGGLRGARAAVALAAVGVSAD
jgi:hypothetical protein